MTIDFYIPIDEIPTGSMTHSLLLSFLKNKYLGTAATKTTLNINYGKSSTPFYGYDGTTNAIPVEIDSCDIQFDTRDSYQGNVLNCSIILHEVV